MLIDLDGSAPGEFEADVAIIGAGAAGITMARRLIDGGSSVLLLESGGEDYEPATADLNAGEVVGLPYYDLETARLRLFGGTTAIWGGRCAELDPLDFKQRPWVEHSGWPVQADELRPYYDAARRALGLPQQTPPVTDRARLLEMLSSDELTVRTWMFDRKFDRFGLGANRALVDEPRLTALTHATVREIIPNENGKVIERLEVVGPGNRKAVVRARTYVLAAGGIENPRLLLASHSVINSGLGNANDQVGRFFMEHPHARGGRLTGARVWPMLRAFTKRRSDEIEFAPLLTPSEELQEKLGILNSALTIAARPPEGGKRRLMKQAYLYAKHSMAPTKKGRGLWKTRRRLGRKVKQLIGPVRPWWSCVRGQWELALVLRAEQAPNPDSRVTLGDSVDAVGMRRVQLDWRMKGQDVESAAALVEALARQVGALRVGEVEAAAWLSDRSQEWAFDDLVSDHPLGGYHHMGTTRMADDPRRGVTDGHGRVHGIDNLYVAGSSLFPTGGWANPTLTILALSLRTAEQILSRPK